MTTKPTHEKNPAYARNVKPPEERRVYISVGLHPETIRLLEPYTSTSRRGQIIDAAVRAYLKDKSP